MRPARLLQMTPVFLLVVVAVNQIRLAEAADISPWKGGGFGMFASTDGGSNRQIRIYLISDERAEEITVPREVIDPYVRAKTLPSNARLEALGLALADYGAERGLTVHEIRLEAWRVVFDRESMLPAKEPLAEFTLTFE